MDGYKEWDFDNWEKAWNIKVGTIYHCEKCKNTVMVMKGGEGVLDLKCCGSPMKEYKGNRDEA